MKKIVILVGPSGSGKTSLANILSSKDFYKPITCTTRSKRNNETHGVDYFFLSQDEFENKINNKELADYDKIFDTYYGVEKTQFSLNDKNIIMPATFLGVSNLRKHFDNVISIFLNPPSIKELTKRMYERKMSESLIKKRIQSISCEMENIDRCDYIVSTNQAIEKSCEDLERILC